MIGSCNSLDEDEYDKDDEDEFWEWFICSMINIVREDNAQVGSIDMQRFKTVIKNDAYSTIKIIE